MDKICLRGIDIYAHHGVHPAERELGQRFVVDVDLWFDCTEAANTDALEDALDYSAVFRCISEVASTSKYQLLEALAGRLCRELLKGFAAQSVEVTVLKPNPPIPSFLGTASVTIKRDKSWLEQLGADPESDGH